MRKILFFIIFIVFIITISPSSVFSQEKTLDDMNREIVELSSEGKYGEAIRVAKKAVVMAEKKYGRKHKTTASFIYNLGLAYLRDNSYKKGLKNLQEAALLWEELLGKESLTTAMGYNGVAVAYELLEKYDRADTWYKKALKAREKKLGKDHPATASSYHNIAGNYKAMGKPAEAEIYYRKALKIREKNPGKNSKFYANTLFELAGLSKVTGKYPQAEKLYKESMKIIEKTGDKDSATYAIYLTQLADFYRDWGKYDKAEELYKKSLAIREKLFGKESPVTASGMGKLAGVFFLKGRFNEAEDLLNGALAIKQKKYGKYHPSLVETLNDLGSLNQAKGKYTDAEKFFNRSLMINKTRYGEENKHTLKSYGNLAGLYTKTGDYQKAEELYKKSLEITEKKLGKESLAVAPLLNNLAILYRHRARYGESLGLMKKALSIYEKFLGKNHPKVATTILNIADLDAIGGNYSEAEAEYEKALDIRRKTFGNDHPGVAVIFNNMAALSESQGRVEKAKKLYERSLEIRIKAYGREHPDVAGNLVNIAGIEKDRGNLEKAEKLYRQALEILKKLLGNDHPDVAKIYNNLAVVYHYRGKLKEEEEFLKKSLDIYKKKLGENHTSTATVYHNLAGLYEEQKRWKEAEEYYNKSLEITEKILGKNHPMLSSDLVNISLLYAKTGDINKSFSLMNRALSIDDGTIEDVFQTSSERQKLEFLAKICNNYQVFLNLVIQKYPHNNRAVIAAMNAVLKRKGIVLDALSKEKVYLLESKDPRADEIQKKLNDVSSSLSALTLSGPGSMNPDVYREKLNRLKDEREKLERELVKISGSYLPGKERSVNCREISHKLPAKSILVEYIKITPFDFKAGGNERKWKEPEYYAFVLPSSKDLKPGKNPVPLFFSLGKADVIDEGVTRFRKEIVRTRKLWENGILDEMEAEKRLAEEGFYLYKLLIAPIIKETGNPETIYISPDGNLNLLPFGPLVDENGKYLLEKYKVNYLSSGRDIPGFNSKRKNNGETVIIADPDYDYTGNFVSDTSIENENPVKQNNFQQWKPLPGTRLEGEDIARILAGEKILEYFGKKALEYVLINIKSPKRLHIATHGFFRDNRDFIELLRIAEKDRDSSSVKGLIHQKTINIQNPLLSSGLVFAGANVHRRKDMTEVDGILTALEISGVNLYGTEMVVLSACETGVGRIQSGEGVYGLRRSFQLAGAQNITMSLWSVPDNETRLLMAEFYRGIVKGEKTSSALRNAKLKMMKQRREKNKSAHPFFWGAFISVGKP